ncbi:hypothetical protein [Haemophilus influenzae]|jgi:hypothetical protein|uniref:hypothetical protein n=1 Tax=Haemophilus influenzae TaxID=727 RepID=UPI000E347550|nr:hypothetical protein [Haemophilus influenzae]RFN77079.1 hypothetical protein CH630_08895 [Haemophilus influenzae]
MYIWTLGLIAWFIFIIIPAHNQTTLYIKIVGVLISSLIMYSNLDWARTYEALNELMKSSYDWLLVKSGGDEKTASAYFYMSLVILSQPFILGGYALYKKFRD